MLVSRESADIARMGLFRAWLMAGLPGQAVSAPRVLQRGLDVVFEPARHTGRGGDEPAELTPNRT